VRRRTAAAGKRHSHPPLPEPRLAKAARGKAAVGSICARCRAAGSVSVDVLV